MILDGPQHLAVRGHLAGGSDPLTVSCVLDLCDRILGERGRREHRFAWLRGPDAAPDDWLAVDAYYPAGRLVVVCHEQPAPDDHLFGELVPARGLRLLELSPSELPSDGAAAETELRRMIEDTGPAPPRVVEAPLPERGGGAAAATETAIARLAAALATAPQAPPAERRRAGAAQIAAAERGARFVAARKAQPIRRPSAQVQASPPIRSERRPLPAPRAAAPREQIHALGVVFGLALVAIVLLEAYLGVVRVAIEAGSPAIGFGLALDAGARALGAVAAGRAGEPQWSWWCALGGSPVVVAFVLREDGPTRVDPAPLAAIVALLAMLVVVMAIVLGALGI